MIKNNNPSGLGIAIAMSIAGYPIYKAFFAVLIAKLVKNDELVAAIEGSYQSLIDSFLDLQATQARLRRITIEERRAMKKLDKYYLKTKRIVKRSMPKEKWPEFGIYDEK